MKRQHIAWIVTCASLTTLMAEPVFSQSPAVDNAGDNGRFVLSPIPEGVLRLDSRTGAVSTCTGGNGNWVCRAVPDERAAYDAEIGKLAAENKALKNQLALALQPQVEGKIDAPLSKEDSLKKSPSTAGSIELKLPDQEKLAAAADRIWQRLRAMAAQLQKKLSEKLG